MISFFTSTRAFEGGWDTRQRNALSSWLRADDDVEILLFGDDSGTAEVAQELGARHFPSVRQTHLGTPLLDDMFARAQQEARHPLLVFANADIIFLDDFATALRQLPGDLTDFLAVGPRWNLDIDGAIDFSAPWTTELRAAVDAYGERAPSWWIDYFVFPRGSIRSLPPFAIGRPGWDNWMIFDARRRGTPVVDLTQVVKAVHQTHDYAHVPESKGVCHTGPEADRNRALASHVALEFGIDDATRTLTPEGLVRRWHVRHLKSIEHLHPRLGLPFRAARRALHAWRAIRAPESR